MSGKSSNSVFVPDVFKNPSKIKVKSEDAKAEPSEEQTPDNKNAPFKKTPPHSDTAIYQYHGEQIPDPYRPLEFIPDPYGSKYDDRENDVQLWINYQKKYTAKFLANEDTKEQRIEDLKNDWINTEHTNDRWLGIPLFTKTTLGDDIFELITSEDGPTRFTRTNLKTDHQQIVFDTNNLSFTSANVTVWSVYISSDNNKYFCDFSRRSGSYENIYCVFDHDGNVIEKHSFDENFRFSFISWDALSKGYYYKNSEAETIYYHAIGSDFLKDHIVLEGNGEISFGCNYTSGHPLTINVTVKTKHERQHVEYVIDPYDPIRLIALPQYSKFSVYKPFVIGACQKYVYAVLSGDYCSRDVIKLPHTAKNWDQAEVILSGLYTADEHDIVLIGEHIVALETESLKTVLRIYTKQGEDVFEFKPETPSALSFQCASYFNNTVKIRSEHYLNPLTIYTLDLNEMAVRQDEIISTPTWMYNITVKREFVPSKDGTKVPLTLLCPQDVKHDGQTPTILYGYGGFGVCETPKYDNFYAHWLKKGYIVAISHIRGDGGWVDGWAESATGQNKPNTFDDFIACAEHLIKSGLTSADKLVSMGASQGGLLVAVCMQKRPDLFGCTICQIPVLDMLNENMHRFDGHIMNTRKEYGSPDVQDDYAVIRSYSPLQNIDPRASYPPMLVMAVGQDRTAHPAHALKFVATMQDRIDENATYLY